MNKTVKILISIAIIIVLAIAVFLGLKYLKPKSKTNLQPINSAEDLEALVEKIYEGVEVELPAVTTQIVDLTDNEAVKYVTGLENGNDFEYVVESLPLMMAQPYSLVLAKVKDGVNAQEVAKKMNENIDNRKWVCVTAEKVYTTNSENIICLVMTNEENAKIVFESFKNLAGTVGEEFEKTEQIDMPIDILNQEDIEAVEQ